MPSRLSTPLLAALLSLVVGSVLHAAPVYVDATVVAASSRDVDIEIATSKAAHEAVLKALRGFARRQIDPATWRTEAGAIELFLRTRGPAYVSSSTMQKRRIESANRVHVWMIVSLEEHDLRQALFGALSRPNCLVACVWALDEVTVTQAVAAEAQLSEAMLASGCNVVSRAQMEEVRWQDYTAAMSRGDYAQASAIGRGFLADTTVSVRLSARRSQNNQGIISAVATADVECVDNRSAGVIFVRHFDPEKGFGLDVPSALDDACRNVMEQVTPYVGSQAAVHRDKSLRSVRVLCEDQLPIRRWEALAEDLKRASLIRDVHIGQSELTCTVEGGALVVGVAAEAVAGYRVESLTDDMVKLNGPTH